ncbi:transposase [Acidobacteria bacterium AH-259-L09]|nr:transposase [Acidobacteria bacterium AH-259-L09]
MAIVHRPSLFTWQSVESRSDLDRLRLVIENLPDEELMVKLEKGRGRGRDDYPVRATWNSVMAGIVFQHESVESLRRELERNGQLRDLCGFDPFAGDEGVPSSDAYSRFLKKLMEEKEEVDQILHREVEELKELLPDFGESLAVDSKALESHARGRKDPKESSDPEADWGSKKKRVKRSDGSLWEKVTSWFGYKLHLVVDSHYELPVGFKITRASASDSPELLPLMQDLKKRHAEIVERAIRLSADRGYDSGDNNAKLWKDFGIKPIIDNRLMWKDQETKLLNEEQADNIVYDEKGHVFCHCPKTDERREMAFQGFEADRDTLKYRCPAAAYGFECAGRSLCGKGNYGDYGRGVRIPLETDPRIFVPEARSSYAWDRDYKKRTAVERVNSRLDTSFNFEVPYIRGKKKMELRVGLALIVMLALAVGHVKAGEKEKMRSLVQRPAA